MGKVKAFIVGVSNYSIPDATDLSLCLTDIVEMKNALHYGLKVEERDIATLGSSGCVTREVFMLTLSEFTESVDENDVIMFYFSGHGATSDDNHYLIFSDGCLNIQDIIEYFEKMPAKSKVVFLDCCYSGGFSVKGTAKFNMEETVAEFQGRGCAVFASSSSNQVSYGRPDNPISIFTGFLCDALQDKYIISKGKVSLYDIQKLVRLYLEIWSRKNPDKQQYPIFKTNVGGTIFFKVQEYVPFCTARIFEEHDEFIIYDVKPIHIGMSKRYATRVILKNPFSLAEIAKISVEVKDIVSGVEVHTNRISKNRLLGQRANIVQVYFGRDESDMLRHNFLCRTTWVDDNQDKNWWYRVDGTNTFIINDVHFDIYPYYERLKIFAEDNTGTKEHVIGSTRAVLSGMITCAEKVISLFNAFKNKLLTEDELFERTVAPILEIDSLYSQSLNLPLPPTEIPIYEWNRDCMCLFDTIYDFTLYYSKELRGKRTSEDLRFVTEMAIERYYSDLERLRKTEAALGLN